MSWRVRRLGAGDLDAARALNGLFRSVFEDEAYDAAPPSEAWLTNLLSKPHVYALVAIDDDQAVQGGLVAYSLDKFEQARTEIYIYDLAVAEAHRRQGLATALIGAMQDLARECGAWVIYVQADYGDDPAIALYTKLGVREDVMHFDIPPAD